MIVPHMVIRRLYQSALQVSNYICKSDLILRPENLNSVILFTLLKVTRNKLSL